MILSLLNSIYKKTLMRKIEFISILAASIIAAAVTSFLVSRSCADTLEPNSLIAPNDSGLSTLPELTLAAKRGVDAVVNITNSQIVRSRRNSSPLYALFGIEQPRREVQSGGSGVIISEDGYIVTNNHVIDNAQTIRVTLSDGTSYTAELVGADPSTDLALIKIQSNEQLPIIKLGDSDNLQLGEWVLAIGNPYGLNSTVTAGIISAKERRLDVIPSDYRVESFLQTDAAVNPGNSGGALVNTRGELIGINTVIKSPTGSFAGYSFAVPSSIVERVVSDLKEFGSVQRALLGIGYNEINEQFAQQANISLSQNYGLYVGLVNRGEAADRSGVEQGDIILAIDGKEIRSSAQFQEIIATQRPGDEIVLQIDRGGKILNIKVVLE